MTPTHTKTYTTKHTVRRRFTFCAAHHLPDNDSPCANTHGHNFECFVDVTGPLMRGGRGQGMVIDFAEIKTVEDQLHAVLDHQDLNTYIAVPTTEHLAEFIGGYFRKRHVPVCRVEVRETENNAAIVEWIDQ